MHTSNLIYTLLHSAPCLYPLPLLFWQPWYACQQLQAAAIDRQKYLHQQLLMECCNHRSNVKA